MLATEPYMIMKISTMITGTTSVFMIDSQRSYNISTTLQDSMKYNNDADIKE